MGTLTLNVTKSSDTTGGISFAVNIADADIGRLSQAYAASYFPQGVLVTAAIPAVPAIPAQPAVMSVDGKTVVTPAVAAVPGVDAVPAVYRAPTAAEVVTAIANGLAQGMLANTVSYERQKAASDAAAGVTPIAVAPV